MNPNYIAEMEPGKYLGYVYPDMVGLTHNKESAMKFRTRPAAWAAIKKAQGQSPNKYNRPFVLVSQPQAENFNNKSVD